MAKLEIPVVVDISEIESLIDEIKHLQTYKLSYGTEQILVDRDDVIKIFAAHVRANIKQGRKAGKTLAEEVERIKREITDIFAEQMGVQPSVQLGRKGKWVDGWLSRFDGTKHWFRECSECGYERDDDNPEKDTNYCPNCGAEMQKVDL